MLVYYFVPFIVSNRYLLFWVSNGHNSVTVQNRTRVYMNFFDHKDLGNHLLQLCPKVVKRPVFYLVRCIVLVIYKPLRSSLSIRVFWISAVVIRVCIYIDYTGRVFCRSGLSNKVEDIVVIFFMCVTLRRTFFFLKAETVWLTDTVLCEVLNADMGVKRAHSAAESAARGRHRLPYSTSACSSTPPLLPCWITQFRLLPLGWLKSSNMT